jgi:nicotinate-nucleotide pyrophosphorylase (carboxylating)
MFNLSDTISNNITQALNEDLGSGDITANLISEDATLAVRLICREQAILCGSQWFEETFKRVNDNIEINWFSCDGDLLQADQTVCELKGNARAILSAERTALNFLQTLSATASITQYYQSLVSSTGCRILDTRKTIPGLRVAQKYAVTCGGGLNHRMGLYDDYLLKENHLAACGSIAEAVQRARQMNAESVLVVEVENLDQLQQAIDARVDRALLDNFSIDLLKQAVALNQGSIQLEASGNIDEDTLLKIAQTGVDFISIGALTKHVRAIDFSLRFID